MFLGSVGWPCPPNTVSSVLAHKTWGGGLTLWKHRRSSLVPLCLAGVALLMVSELPSRFLFPSFKGECMFTVGKLHCSIPIGWLARILAVSCDFGRAYRLNIYQLHVVARLQRSVSQEIEKEPSRSHIITYNRASNSYSFTGGTFYS